MATVPSNVLQNKSLHTRLTDTQYPAENTEASTNQNLKRTAQVSDLTSFAVIEKMDGSEDAATTATSE